MPGPRARWGAACSGTCVGPRGPMRLPCEGHLWRGPPSASGSRPSMASLLPAPTGPAALQALLPVARRWPSKCGFHVHMQGPRARGEGGGEGRRRHRLADASRKILPLPRRDPGWQRQPPRGPSWTLTARRREAPPACQWVHAGLAGWPFVTFTLRGKHANHVSSPEITRSPLRALES